MCCFLQPAWLYMFIRFVSIYFRYLHFYLNYYFFERRSCNCHIYFLIIAFWDFSYCIVYVCVLNWLGWSFVLTFSMYSQIFVIFFAAVLFQLFCRFCRCDLIDFSGCIIDFKIWFFLRLILQVFVIWDRTVRFVVFCFFYWFPPTFIS